MYRGDGAFGQFCVVMPDRDAVVAITSGVGDMQAVLNLVWEHLLPAMGDAPLPEDRAAQEELGQKLASLSLAPAQGEPASPLANSVSGKVYTFEANEQQIESIAFDLSAECAVTVRDGSGEHRLACGSGRWLKGTASMGERGVQPVAASGAWAAPDTYRIKFCFYETPFCPTITCRFVEDRLLYDFRANVGFGPTERPQLVGRMKG
jgi:hypothetical protein